MTSTKREYSPSLFGSEDLYSESEKKRPRREPENGDSSPRVHSTENGNRLASGPLDDAVANYNHNALNPQILALLQPFIDQYTGAEKERDQAKSLIRERDEEIAVLKGTVEDLRQNTVEYRARVRELAEEARQQRCQIQDFMKPILENGLSNELSESSKELLRVYPLAAEKLNAHLSNLPLELKKTGNVISRAQPRMRRLLYETKELSQLLPDGPALAFGFILSWGRVLYEQVAKDPTWKDSDEFEHLDKWVRHVLKFTKSQLGATSGGFSAESAAKLLEQRDAALAEAARRNDNPSEPVYSHSSQNLDGDNNNYTAQSNRPHRRPTQSATVENEPLRSNQARDEPMQDDEPEIELTTITLALSREVTLEELKHRQRQFYQHLFTRPLKLEVGRKVVPRPLSQKEAAEITNFFFRIFTDVTKVRLTEIAIGYASRSAIIPYDKGIEAADRLVNDRHMPLPARELFRTISPMLKRDRGKGSKNENCYTELLKTTEMVNTFRAYKDFAVKARDRNPEVLALLRKHDLKTSPGISYSHLVNTLLSKTLKMDKKIIARLQGETLAIGNLSQIFGKGIMLILSDNKGASSMKAKWGSRMIIAIAKVFSGILPELEAVCTCAEIHFLDVTENQGELSRPWRNGTSLRGYFVDEDEEEDNNRSPSDASDDEGIDDGSSLFV